MKKECDLLCCIRASASHKNWLVLGSEWILFSCFLSFGRYRKSGQTLCLDIKRTRTGSIVHRSFPTVETSLHIIFGPLAMEDNDIFADYDDGVLTERQYDEGNNNDEEEEEDNINNIVPPAAPIKRRRDTYSNISEEKKKRVKTRLFTEDKSQTDRVYNEEEINELKRRPTLNRIVCGDEILDLTFPLPGYEGASVMLTNVFNTFIHIVQYKTSLLSLKNRKLAIQLRATEYHMRQLEENDYKGAHIVLPRMVESLFSMLDYRNNPIYINHMKPISCVLSKKLLMDKIYFKSMEATSKNDSNYIEVMFNNPFRFIFVGCAKRGGPHNKNEVSLFPFFGEYINKAINDMYEVMYTLVSKEIENAQKVLEKTKETTTETKITGLMLPPNNGLQSIENFSNGKSTKDSNGDRLNTYLRSIKTPLAKREYVDILVTSGNSGKKSLDAIKMCYLTVEDKDKDDRSRGSLKMVDTDVTDDSVYMSSYIRCRVLLVDKPTFGLQIYTRHAIKLLTIDDRLVKFGEFTTKESSVGS